ncbi:retrotransposon protein, putative, ty1-copia subclass [Tanacetum coccineum]|uniref:Retrotransposon protein, putative, ty1-copia subclass n=1 Tax=Tanacetum coccineum TaxID=301880 RepID=A0ABQ5FKR8_9ASTR
MAANQTTNNNSIMSILDKEKLNGSNFLDWYRNLRIVLRNEQKFHRLEEALPEALPLQLLLFAMPTLMKAYLDQMERLGYPIPLVLEVNLILTLLSKEYDQFVQNYNIHSMGKTIRELHAMLKLAEKGKGKNKDKGKSKLSYDPKHKIPPPAKKEHPAKDTECHHCHKLGHWKKNCPLYLVELKKNKANTSSTLGLKGIRKFNKGALDLYVGNVNRAAVEAIGGFDLIIHSGMVFVPDNYHFTPSITRGVISLSYERKPFTYASERDDDLLGIIHSDSNDVANAFWGYALESVARILNMVPIKKVDKTTYEIWHRKVSNLSYLKVWGYEALVKRDMPNKLESRSIKCIFVGYPNLISQEASGSTVDFDEIQMQDAQTFGNTSEHQLEVEHDDVEPQTDEHELGDHGEPTNYRAALSNHESNKRLEAKNVEMQSMKDNQVLNLVDLPPNCKTVGSKWLFKKKTDMDGNIHTYKARLVAKGSPQTYGVDYEETLSPIADIKAIRILIAIVAYYDYEIWQMDVKTAFLNGRLNEDVYMVKPKGFVNLKHPRRVCKLQRSIYGLKQASRSWNKRFDEEIKKYGNNIPMQQDVKSWLGKCFAMNDLCEATYILESRSIEIDQGDLSKTQGPYTPAEVKRMKGVPYASAVGSIIYTVRCTRPDVAFSHNLMSRYQQNPGESHWTALSVTCYTDTSWETDRDDLRSQTWYVFMMNGGTVDWKSSKQSNTAMSSTKVEYIAASEAAMEAIWIRKFISELGVVPTNDRPIDMYCDKTGTITIADEPGAQKDAKHF